MKEFSKPTYQKGDFGALYLIISAQKSFTKMMRFADLFDDAKAIGFPQELYISYSQGVARLERAANLIDVFAAGFKSSSHDLWFCHLMGVINDGNFVLNKSQLPFIDKKIREISDGHKHYLFRDYLTFLGFKVTTTENLFITEIEFNS